MACLREIIGDVGTACSGQMSTSSRKQTNESTNTCSMMALLAPAAEKLSGRQEYGPRLGTGRISSHLFVVVVVDAAK